MAAKEFVWYVYELSDSLDGAVFYVGKGKGSRLDAHEKEARTGVVSHKCNKIRSIWEKGGIVVKTKVAMFSDEKQAYIHEADRIADYGLDNLTNSLLACTLVSNKAKLVDKSERAFKIICALPSHFASWMRLSEFGKYKLQISNCPDWTKAISNLFYNDFAESVYKQVVASEKYALKLAEKMKPYNIHIHVVTA